MHALVVIPYYVFLALTVGAFLSVVVHALRLPVAMERIGAIAVFGSIALLTVALLSPWLAIEHLTFLPLLALGTASFLLAAVDALLLPSLAPAEGPHGRRTQDPQVL